MPFFFPLEQSSPKVSLNINTLEVSWLDESMERDYIDSAVPRNSRWYASPVACLKDFSKCPGPAFPSPPESD